MENTTDTISGVNGSIGEYYLWDMHKVANYLHVSYYTVQRMVKRFEIPHTRIGNRPRFEPPLVKKWLEDRRIGGKV